MTTSNSLSFSSDQPSHEPSSAGGNTSHRNTVPLRKMTGEGMMSPSVSSNPVLEREDTEMAGRGASAKMSTKLLVSSSAGGAHVLV